MIHERGIIAVVHGFYESWMTSLEVEHTLPIDDTMEALQIICSRNGGQLA